MDATRVLYLNIFSDVYTVYRKYGHTVNRAITEADKRAGIVIEELTEALKDDTCTTVIDDVPVKLPERFVRMMKDSK